jgi:hypothetical protein
MTIADSLASLLATGRTVRRTLSGAGHFLMLEQPAAWADTIRQFTAGQMQHEFLDALLPLRNAERSPILTLIRNKRKFPHIY